MHVRIGRGREGPEAEAYQWRGRPMKDEKHTREEVPRITQAHTCFY